MFWSLELIKREKNLLMVTFVVVMAEIFVKKTLIRSIGWLADGPFGRSSKGTAI